MSGTTMALLQVYLADGETDCVRMTWTNVLARLLQPTERHLIPILYNGVNHFSALLSAPMQASPDTPKTQTKPKAEQRAWDADRLAEWLLIAVPLMHGISKNIENRY